MKTKHDEVYKLEQQEVEIDSQKEEKEEEENLESELMNSPPCCEVEAKEQIKPYFAKEELFEFEDNLPKVGFLLEDPLAWAFIDVHSPTWRIYSN